jgi:hypothetical protein
MSKLPIAVFVLMTLVTGGPKAFGQGDTDCLSTLSHAESEFAAGRFIGIPGLLNECLQGNRFSNEEKVRVYMLLTQVYLLTDNHPAADDAYLKLLNANPEFVPSDLDPIDVVYLSKKFTSTPIFTPHLKLGVNASSQAIIWPQNVISTPDTTQISRRILPGFTVGGGVEWNITDNIGIGGEILLSQKRFTTRMTNLFRNDDEESEERQLWLDIPVYARWGMNTGKIRPFVYAGGAINLLLTASVEEQYNDVEGDNVTPTPQLTRNIMYKRNLLNRSLVFGGGAKFKLGKDFVVVDVRYMPGLSNVTKLQYNNYSSKVRDEIDPSMWQFATIGDMFRVNNFSLSLGYVRPLYNPRKAGRVRTKAVSRKLGKEDKEDK